jgi:hypothetical protein
MKIFISSIALLCLCLAIVLHQQKSDADHISHKDPLSRPSVATDRQAATGPFPASIIHGRPPNQIGVAAEVLYSTDLRATYEKYKSRDDPSGQISYFLSKALDDCTPFVGKTPEEISASMNAIGKIATENRDRSALIVQLIDRCKGFADWDSPTLIAHYNELKQKAVLASYPAAIAQTLSNRIASDGTEKTDAIAISLLSSNVDDGVIKGIYDYLLRRNGNEWLAQAGNPAIAVAAWTMLACNMGADCGDRNNVAVAACLYYGACNSHDVVTVLPAVYPALTPDRLENAIALETTLGNAIQSRDWARLGFTFVRTASSSAERH